MKTKKLPLTLLKTTLTLILGFLWVPTSAQNPDRSLVEVQTASDQVKVMTNDGMYVFKPYSPEIMEVSFIPPGEYHSTESHAVVMRAQKVPFEVTEGSDSLLIDSNGIDVVINKHPFQVSYYYQGRKVISERSGYARVDKMEQIEFNLRESEVLFGGGARALGMNRRGNRLKLYNQPHYGYTTKSEVLNYSLPIVLSSEMYAIHFDNAPTGVLDLDSQYDNSLTYQTIGGRKTYQLLVGDSWESLVGNFTLLTGRQPLPPRWALGNFSSRFGYHSQEEVMNTIKKFREEEIPVDAIILDLYWFGHQVKGTMGNLTFVKDSFPTPAKMIGELKKQGVQTILITEPYVLTSSKRWKQAVAAEVLARDRQGDPFVFDFYFGNTGLIDIFDPKARKWFWKIYEGLTQLGVGGWWGDLGEPEVHPKEMQHATGSADEVHNIYGHYWAKLIYDGYREDFPGKRAFILMRAGAAGSQRFGLIPWSGDVSRSWGGLEPQPEIALQMGLQGLAYMHSDLGGFAGERVDDQLYVRWLQYGVFQPVFRPHAHESVAAEPVFRSEKAKALAKEAIILRYKLLPYNYTLAFRNSVEGTPFMRPLFFEEPENFRLYSISQEYLWGKDILVAPVLRPDILSKEIYFPGTSNWFDYYSGEKYPAGTTRTVAIKPENIPTFIRGGAFIPMSKPLQTTQNFHGGMVELHYFYDQAVEKSAGTLYHDDGITRGAYNKGDFELLNFDGERLSDKLQVTVNRELGSARKISDFDKIDLIIHNLNFTPSTLQVNGEAKQYQFDSETGELQVQINLGNQTTITIHH